MENIFSNKLKIDIFPACSIGNPFAFYIYFLPINPDYLLIWRLCDIKFWLCLIWIEFICMGQNLIQNRIFDEGLTHKSYRPIHKLSLFLKINYSPHGVIYKQIYMRSWGNSNSWIWEVVVSWMRLFYNSHQIIILFKTNFNFKSNKLEWLWEYVAGKSNIGSFYKIVEGNLKDLISKIVENYFIFIHKVSHKLNTKCVLIMRSSEDNSGWDFL